MAVTYYPLNGKSLLPPRTLAKVNRLDAEGRRLYLAQLLYDSTHRINNLESVANNMREEWLDSQVTHLNRVLTEIQSMLDLETGGTTDFKGHTNNDNAQSDSC